jgi:hypothetical protein
LYRCDALLEEGTIGGAAPNAADLQILTSIRLLLAHEDLLHTIAPRQAALRLIPDYPRSGADALPAVPLPFRPSGFRPSRMPRGQKRQWPLAFEARP